jgi:hypothetical protein
VAGTCGYGEEISGSINAGNFLTSCKVYWLASQDRLLHGVSKSVSKECKLSYQNKIERELVFSSKSYMKVTKSYLHLLTLMGKQK